MRAISLCTAFMSSPMKFISLCSTKKLDLLVIVGRISKGISTRNINFLVFVRKFPELCSTWKQNIFLSSEAAASPTGDVAFKETNYPRGRFSNKLS